MTRIWRRVANSIICGIKNGALDTESHAYGFWGDFNRYQGSTYWRATKDRLWLSNSL